MRLVRSNILSKQRIFPGGKHKYNTRLAESHPAPRLTGYPARLDWPGLSWKIENISLVSTTGVGCDVVTGPADEKYFNLIKFVDLPFSIRYVPGGAMTTRLPIGRLGNNTPILLVSGQSGQFSIDTLHLACLIDQQFGVRQYISLQYIQPTIRDLILGNAIHLEMKSSWQNFPLKSTFFWFSNDAIKFPHKLLASDEPKP